MRVVFLEDVLGVAQGGDIREVKNGFARNYLIPKNLAVPATHDSLLRVERLRKQADIERDEMMADVGALAQELDGAQVNIEMRAGTGERLYGSVTNTMVAAELAKIAGREIDRRMVEITEPVRQLGTFDVNVRLHPEVSATVKVVVYATGTEPQMLVDTGTDEADVGEIEVLPIAEVESAEAEVETAEAEVESAEAEVESIEAEVEGAEAEVEGETKETP